MSEENWDDGKAAYKRYPDREFQPFGEEAMIKGFSKLPGILKQFDYEDLRPGQKPVVLTIMSGRDVLCILPTSGGKSATFAIPTLCMGWNTLVFSPLVSLMRDQVMQFSEKDVRVAQMSSTQTDAQNALAARLWAAGELSLFYVAPERLRSKEFMEAIRQRRPDMVAVDEAHCLSAWGDNFRPDYCTIGDFINEYNPKVVAAFSATAPPEVEEDIRRVLGIRQAPKLVNYYRRENLKLRSCKYKDLEQVADILDRKPSGTGIVYFSSVRRVEESAAILQNLLKKEVGIYHGQLNPAVKASNQDRFMSGSYDVMCATSAFGMGVNKGDVRQVIHPDIPGTVEALAQEVGRAGRDGKESECVTMLSDQGISTQEFFIRNSHPSKQDIMQVFNAIVRHAGSDGICRMTAEDIAFKASVQNKFCIPSIIAVLVGSRCIERSAQTEKILKFKLTGMSDDDRFAKYMGAVANYGVKGEGGFLEIDREFLLETLDIKAPTLQRYVKIWEQAGLIQYIPPYRGSLTRVSGDLSHIDFPRLEEKREGAYAKLEQVIEYAKLPNSSATKHDYLENYFKVENSIKK